MNTQRLKITNEITQYFLINLQLTNLLAHVLCVSVQNARSRVESIEKQLTHLSVPKTPTCRKLRKITYHVTGHSSAYNERAPRMRIMEISATKHAFGTD